ncbi:MAG: cellulose binding domain-containing protein [Streptosporangiaceae bacterium]|nr:cellulose binding domain-containing protein [Streptosporangiaceae bacterium]MBV9853495.1 cellulose binding domain-containing protein [Streptosporangiaceae bacterium]
MFSMRSRAHPPGQGGSPGRAPRGHRAARLAAGLLLGGALAAGGASAAASPANAAALTASVTVNATAGLGTVPAHAIGLNTAVYDGYMNDTAIPPLLKAAGIDALRYPGGSYSDIYNWQTGTAAAGGYVAPNTSFSSFMGTANAAGAAPVITVNYGTGTPSLAAAWVQAAASDNVQYWEVGNEVYGNGTYGANWEVDSHCKTSLNGPAVTVGSEPSQTYNCGPAEYAANVLQYMSAMHAANANAKVCAVLTTPGFWPDGVTNSEYPNPWNQTVLSALGASTQCVIVHYYPGGSTTAGMLTDPSDIAGIVSTLHSQLSQYAKISNPSSVPVIVTETNSTIDLDTQPAALFAADMYMTWLENGVTNVDWWDEHNGIGTPSTVDGTEDYNDQGIFSSASNGSGVTEPAVDTPFAPYYGIEMLSKLAAPGATMVTSASSQSLLRVHAVRDSSGNLNILIDNEDPSNSYTVSLGYSGFTASGTPTVYTLANNATSITSASGSSSSVTAGPYSLTVVHVPGSGGTGVTAPGAPGQPVASNLSSSTSSSTSGTATLTWPASAAGTYPVAHYNVYQVTSSGSTLAATTAGTTVNLTGLTVGASYTYNVVAADSQGNSSLPSPPVMFTVPPPSNAGCAVHYAVSSSWPGGFGASVTITNKAATAVSGWTLTWTWPASGEAVASGWNGTYSQSGANVTVTNASWNSQLPASGGSVSIGFNGSDTGQDPPPVAFYLNGSICGNN